MGGYSVNLSKFLIGFSLLTPAKECMCSSPNKEIAESMWNSFKVTIRTFIVLLYIVIYNNVEISFKRVPLQNKGIRV